MDIKKELFSDWKKFEVIYIIVLLDFCQYPGHILGGKI